MERRGNTPYFSFIVVVLISFLAIRWYWFHLYDSSNGNMYRENRRLAPERLKVIKTYRDRAVYVLDTNNTRHVIPDWSTFVSLGYDQREIITLRDEEMNAIPEGEPLDPIVEEKLPQNPYSQCPCFANSQYVSLMKNSSIHKPSYQVCFVNSTVLYTSRNKLQSLFKFASALPLKLEEKSEPFHGSHRLRYVLVSSQFSESLYRKRESLTQEIEHCDLLVELVEDLSYYKYECPEKCIPIPYTKIPVRWLTEELPETLNKNLPVTCSMTWEDLLSEKKEFLRYRHQNHNLRSLGSPANPDVTRKLLEESITGAKAIPANSHNHHITAVHVLLKLILLRRLEECHEKDDWKMFTQQLVSIRTDTTELLKQYEETKLQSFLKRKRKVFGLILWVGSRTRYSLLEDQIQVLKVQNFSNPTAISPENVIAGWLASEDQYGCRVGSTLCEEVSPSLAYFNYMPNTRLNVASAGWACAQRRPLRAISHVLLLYDPSFLLIVDDDTYVSMELIQQPKFREYILTSLKSDRMILGQLTQGRKVTRRGFYYGGSGYLIGSQTIADLNAYSVMSPKESMNKMIDPTQMRFLSVYNQILPLSQQLCPTCMKAPEGTSVGDLGLTANLSIRMIDICVNLMSQEHTCYHSDHAISRCFIHGVYAYPLDVACGGSQISSNGLYFGMCMGISQCQTNVQLTCHRWKPSRSNSLRPINLEDPKMMELEFNETKANNND